MNGQTVKMLCSQIYGDMKDEVVFDFRQSGSLNFKKLRLMKGKKFIRTLH